MSRQEDKPLTVEEFNRRVMEASSESQHLQGEQRGSFVEREQRAKRAGYSNYLTPAKRRMLAIRRLRGR